MDERTSIAVPDSECKTVADNEDFDMDPMWSNPDIIPFTREHERMLTEIHALITGAAKQIEEIAPTLKPMLGSMGIAL